MSISLKQAPIFRDTNRKRRGRENEQNWAQSTDLWSCGECL